MLADRIVNSWIREQVLLAQAEESLLEENEKLESQIQTYRNALLISEYENRFVNSRLNRTVTEFEVDGFHKTHPELFKLSEHVVRADAVKAVLALSAFKTGPLAAKANGVNPKIRKIEVIIEIKNFIGCNL